MASFSVEIDVDIDDSDIIDEAEAILLRGDEDDRQEFVSSIGLEPSPDADLIAFLERYQSRPAHCREAIVNALRDNSLHDLSLAMGE